MTRQLLQEQWTAFDQDRTAVLTELDHRSAELSQQQEALEIKSQRVEKLRGEVELLNQELLEQWVVVEQVRGDLDRRLGSEQADTQIQEVQARLHQQWKHVRESLVEQRDELDTSRQALQRLRDEFHSERENLTNWVSQREYQLHAVEDALTRERSHAQETENRWSTARERWREEKMAAENVIRGLLLQLEIMVSRSPETLIPTAPRQPFFGHDTEEHSVQDELGELTDAA